MEQKKVVRDSSGREQSTVTRSIGEQTHSVTTILDEQGRKEHREDFNNMDESMFDDVYIPLFRSDLTASIADLQGCRECVLCYCLKRLIQRKVYSWFILKGELLEIVSRKK